MSLGCFSALLEENCGCSFPHLVEDRVGNADVPVTIKKPHRVIHFLIEGAELPAFFFVTALATVFRHFLETDLEP